jgi:trigger factor
MEILKRDLQENHALLQMTLHKEDYMSQVEETIKTMAKTASMPGFRKGKAPVSAVRSQYQNKVTGDEVNKLINEQIYQYIQDNKLKVLGQPIPSQEESQHKDLPEGSISLCYEIGLIPHIDIKKMQSLALDYCQIELDGTLVDKEIEALRQRHGKMQEVDFVSKGDLLVGTFSELDANERILEGGVTNTSSLLLSMFADEMQELFINKVIGDVVSDLDLSLLTKSTEDLSSLLGISKEHAKDLQAKFSFTIEKIKHVEPAEINEEFIHAVLGDESDVKDFQGLQEKIKQDYRHLLSRDEDKLFYKQSLKKLVAESALALPDEFLKKWILATNEKPISAEQLEKEFPFYVEELKAELIKNAILESLQVRYDHEQMLQFTQQLIQDNFLEQGFRKVWNKEIFRQQAESYLKTPKNKESVYNMFLAQSVIDYLKATWKINTKVLGHEAFIEAYQGL